MPPQHEMLDPAVRVPVVEDEVELASLIRYVRYLREKVDRPFGVETIETVRGAGYRLRAA